LKGTQHNGLELNLNYWILKTMQQRSGEIRLCKKQWLIVLFVSWATAACYLQSCQWMAQKSMS